MIPKCKKKDDSGWIDMSQYIDTEYFAARGGFKPMARKIGNVVYWKGYIYCIADTNSSGKQIFKNLPNWVRPNYEVLVSLVRWGNDNLPYTLLLEPNGNMQIHQYNENISVQFDWNGYGLSDLSGYLVD